MKNLLFTLFLGSTLFAACGGDDDSSIALVYNLCNTTQSFSENEKIVLKTYNATEIPINIRSYVSSEFPGYSISNVTLFELPDGRQFTEVITNNGGTLLFDMEGLFVCGDSSFMQGGNNDDDNDDDDDDDNDDDNDDDDDDDDDDDN